MIAASKFSLGSVGNLIKGPKYQIALLFIILILMFTYVLLPFNADKFIEARKILSMQMTIPSFLSLPVRHAENRRPPPRLVVPARRGFNAGRFNTSWFDPEDENLTVSEIVSFVGSINGTVDLNSDEQVLFSIGNWTSLPNVI